ncbi:ATP-binding protein [Vibrio sp. S4M6]|uniref:sensor histidine kinase n=1 Tax=Vibrio sinus TaxID=2946865 RepID=UPI00202A0DC3|nr:ATP-binding protein [Vibrio sinus]MCL9781238.1 ATP-binding protein [Vibrio sinus]
MEKEIKSAKVFFLFFLLILVLSVIVPYLISIKYSVDSSELIHNVSKRIISQSKQSLEEMSDANKEKYLNELKYNFGFNFSLVDSIPKYLPDWKKNKIDKTHVIFDKKTKSLFVKSYHTDDLYLKVGPIPMVYIMDLNTMYSKFTFLVYFSLAVSLVLLFFIFRSLIPYYSDINRIKEKLLFLSKGQTKPTSEDVKSPLLKPVDKIFAHVSNQIGTHVTINKNLANTIAHEIRTPLSKLKFYLEMFDEDVPEEKKSSYKAKANRAIREADDIISLILNYSAFEHSGFALSPTKMNVNSAVENMTLALDEISHPSRLRYNYDKASWHSGLFVEFDIRMVNIALINICSNALKYANERVNVQFSCSDSRLCIHVDDDGQGVQAGEKERIFELFYTKSDDLSSGYGFGLGFSKLIMQAHGGDITVGDSPMGGARFTIEINVVS